MNLRNTVTPLTASIAILFLLGTLLLYFLTVLSGATEHSILKTFYWLQADCSKFPGAPFSGQCRWTNYAICAVVDGYNHNCIKSAAHPFSPKDNFSSTVGVPMAFINNRNYYYYTSRIGYAFELVGISFLTFSLMALVVHLFTKFKVKLAFKGLFWSFYILAFVFTVISVALSTSAYAKGRQKFRDDGIEASLGTKTWAVAWTTVALMLINMPLLALATVEWNKGRDSFYSPDYYTTNKESYQEPLAVNPVPTSTGPWFKRRSATKNSSYSQQPPISATPAIKEEVKAGAVPLDKHPADDTLQP